MMIKINQNLKIANHKKEQKGFILKFKTPILIKINKIHHIIQKIIENN